MDDPSNEEVATAWIENCRAANASGSSSPVAQRMFWAYEALDELCSAEPKRALQIIREICEKDPEPRVWANLAAGPFESLIVRHGLTVLPHLKQLLPSSMLRQLLEGVWTNDMDPGVVQALEQL